MMSAVANPLKYGQEIKVREDGFSLTAFVSPFNRRVRLVDYRGPGVEEVPAKLKEIAADHDFASKIFAKVPKGDESHFISEGFTREGEIAGYFDGEDASVVSFFYSESRRETEPATAKKEEEIYDQLQSVEPREGKPRQLPDGYKMEIAVEPAHFEDLARLYRQVFKTYPFPIFNPDYLARTAKSHITYALVYDEGGNLVAAASAEMDRGHKNAEMTDFATLPSQRGKGLAGKLLYRLEKSAYDQGVRYFYTIARSRSFGMNRVFRKAGYEFTGKLKNNCSICGQLENMSIWCKVMD